MALSLQAADTYVGLNVIDIEDWTDSDTARKQRILNVAERTLKSEFGDLVIPDEAVYEFVPILAAAFNDTNKMQAYGIRSFSMEGMSFSFAQEAPSLANLIPQSVRDLIAGANGTLPMRRRIGRSVR